MQGARPRPATAADYAAYAALFPELRTGDTTPPFEAWRDRIAPRTIVIDLAGEAVAYAHTMTFGAIALVTNVVVRADARGAGLGRMLLAELARRLRSEGCTRWLLNVKPDNAPALALYRRFGFEPMGRAWSLRLPYAAVQRLPEPARPHAAIAVSPADDAAVEREFELPPGQLAMQRGHGRAVLGVVADPRGETRDPWLGVASFDPRFPGAMPFRVRDVAVTRPLVAAVRTHALPEHDFVLLTVERDPALRDVLVAGGATLRFEMLQMQGAIADRR